MSELSEVIRVRVTPEHKAAFAALARRAPMSLSTWCRMALCQAWRDDTGTFPTTGDGSRPSDLEPAKRGRGE